MNQILLEKGVQRSSLLDTFPHTRFNTGFSGSRNRENQGHQPLQASAMFGSLGVRGERLQRLFGGRLEAPRTKNRLHIPSATTSSTLAHFHLQSCLLPLGTRASREIIVRDNGELLTFCCSRRLREVHVHASESGDKAEDKAKEFTYNPEKGQGR